MIPKIIHYCWFGPNPIPQREQECMESWKKYFPDYTFMYWNEQTFDIEKFAFTREANEKKSYAFVSDFVRVYALHKYGGIYLDTDVEILKDPSSVLSTSNLVLGFESSTHVGTAFVASIAEHPVITDLFDYYINRSFVNSMGMCDITANPLVLASVLKKYGVIFNGKHQNLEGISLYKQEIFFPEKIGTNQFKVTAETLAIHHFSASWLTDRQKKREANKLWVNVFRPVLRCCRKTVELIAGEGFMKKIETIIRNILK